MSSFPLTSSIGFAAGASWTAYRLLTRNQDAAPETGPWTPPQWQKPQLWSMTINWPVTKVTSRITTTESISSGDTGQTVAAGTEIPGSQPQVTFQPTTYFFDGVLRSEHVHQSRRTEHPVQFGAAITDHIIKLPAHVMIEILISDAMGRLTSGLYSSDGPKGQSAFAMLEKIKDSGMRIALQTRLKSYENMVIEDVRASDDYRTRHGLRAMVQFGEIMIGTIATATVPVVTARPEQTDAPAQVVKQPQPLSSTVQNKVDQFRKNPGSALTKLGVF